MHPHPESAMMLADIRHRDLQNEAAQLRLARETDGDGSTMRATISTAYCHLGVMLARAHQHLEGINWTLTVPRRGAFPR